MGEGTKRAMARKRLLQALAGEMTGRPAFWLMRQAGRYLPEYREMRKRARDFLAFCYTPDLAVEVTLQPLRRYGMDAAILFSDILVVPDALGQKVAFREGEGPVLEPVRNVGEVAKLDRGGFLERLEPVFEIVRRLVKEVPKETALIGFAGAPWTVAVYMVEGRGGTDCGTAKGWAYKAPEEFRRLIDLLTDVTVDYLDHQIQNGAETVQLFDSWAGVLSESQFHRWVVEPTVRIVKALKERHPQVPVIGFPRGAGMLYGVYAEETGIDGVSLDSGIPLKWAAGRLQRLCTVQGNLDNHLLLSGGKAMIEEAERILDTLGEGPFIFNLGHGILPGTPPEHVEELAETIRKWRPRGL